MSTSRIEIKRGDTWSQDFFWTDAAGAAVDLTGCSARLMLRVKETSALAIEATTTTGDLVITALTGAVALTVSAERMRAVAAGSYQMDLEITWADGTVRSTETLAVKVLPDVTYTDE